MKRIVLLFIAVLFILPTQLSASERVLDIQEVKSSKGINTWLVEDHSLPIITIYYAFAGAGAAGDDIEKQGLARMASNTMDEGAGEMKSHEFQKMLEDNSISLGFQSSRDNFTGILKTLTKNKELAFSLAEMAVTRPRFDKEAVDRMRQANVARIKSSLSNPNWVAARIMNDTIFAGHPYSFNSGGTLSTLENITSEDLHKFATSRLALSNLHVAAVGDISAEELKLVVDEIFGKLPKRARLRNAGNLKLRYPGTVNLFKRDIPQTIIQITQPGIDRSNPDYHIAKVMNYILGGGGFGTRLTVSARERRGLTYGIYSYLQGMEKTDIIGLQTSTKNENLSEMMHIIKSEWKKMASEPVSDEELKTAKSYLIGSLPLSLTSTSSIAQTMLSLMLDDMPIDYLDKRKIAIDKVTKEDVLRVASDLLDVDKMTTVLVGQGEGVDVTRVIDVLPNVE